MKTSMVGNVDTVVRAADPRVPAAIPRIGATLFMTGALAGKRSVRPAAKAAVAAPVARPWRARAAMSSVELPATAKKTIAASSRISAAMMTVRRPT